MTLWRISAIQRGLIDRLFVAVDAQFDHAKRNCTTYEDVAAAICIAGYSALSPYERVHELRVIDFLCICILSLHNRKYREYLRTKHFEKR